MEADGPPPTAAGDDADGTELGVAAVAGTLDGALGCDEPHAARSNPATTSATDIRPVGAWGPIGPWPDVPSGSGETVMVEL